MSSNELLKILLSDGWYIHRQSGSHAIVRHPDKAPQIVVPIHSGRDLGKGIVRAILKRAQIISSKR
jgi:mRNA interferase HicA